MAQAKVKSKSELGDYVLRRLGQPVVQVEITPEQLNDCIDETIEMFIEVAHSGTQGRVYALPAITGQQIYQMPYECVAVLQVWDYKEIGSTSTLGDTSNLFSIRNILARDFVKGEILRADLLTIELVNQFISTMNVIFSEYPTWDYNTFTKQLYLYEAPKADQTFGLLVYEQIDQDLPEHANIFDQRWVKKYSVECARYQWAMNLSKYSGSVLPGGLQLDVPAMVTEANQNKEKLEEELRDKYELPPDFFIG